MTDEDLLALLKVEKARAIGFENSSELSAQRAKGIEYNNGVMSDMVAMPNRSKAVSTDVSDAIQTLLPNLLDIFTGGEDVATFIPRGADDEDAASQETEYVNQVVFQQNGGFLTLYTMISDALTQKTGVVKWWWEDYDAEQEVLEDQGQPQLMALMRQEQQGRIKIVAIKPGEDGTAEVTIENPAKGKLCVKPVPPDDFAVGLDTTVLLSEATYCAMRSRPRAQDLLARGISRSIVDDLPNYGATQNDTVNLARDTVDENTQATRDATGDMRQVEVIEHHIRIEEKGRLQLYKVETDSNETLVISSEKVNRIQYAAITPFIVTHRFYGWSVADMLIQLQQINTALTRQYMDSIYFALNQRAEIASDKSSEWTLMDFARNEPGVPIRVRTSGAVTPVVAGGAGFDGLAALEHFATKVESRTGIVRNAQGLNPDTLHDTAKGAIVLMGAAQRRERLIARIFAETGIKDLFLGVHATLREHARAPYMAKMAGKWIEVDPSTWGERADMNIEIGLGSGGKEQDLIAMEQQKEVLQLLVEAQGGPNGPIVTPENLYNFAKRFFGRTGAKTPELFLTDPQGKPITPPQQAGPAGPDPQIEGMKLQLQGMKQQQDAQVAQAKLQLDQMKLQQQGKEHEHAMAMDAINTQWQQQFDAQKASIDESLALRKLDAQYQTSVTVAQIKAEAEQLRIRADLAIQASEAHHAAQMQQNDHAQQRGAQSADHAHQGDMQSADHEAQASQAAEAAKAKDTPK